MAVNLSHKFGTGITPKQFIDSMEKNKDTFQSNYDAFEWSSEQDREFFASLERKDDLRVLILAADWCGDVVRNVPVVFRALETAGIQTEVLVMEQHLDVMDQFLTFGGRSIPVVIFTNADGDVLDKWGPRPAHVQKHMAEFKQNYPDREAPEYQDKLMEVRKDIHKAYGEQHESAAAIIAELRHLISGV
ncbi:thioredoxin family protein [Paenibacillus lemnae]|uniref:Thioredoxin family protein n=1 Tax=Paenibacillus lemnae TaxID=1330551 RepID=A0A848MC04_PAELE|nr:thioredoxin family protein [Paenibacillus lemnae]NMO98235.1 thioredoxin family protein [Paenibacillus lemnae]